MNLSKEALETFYAKAESCYKELNDEQVEVIVHYAGDLNLGFSGALINRVEKLVEEKIDDKKARKKFFTVFIEAIQNIRIHGGMDEDKHIHSVITVYRSPIQLKAQFSNLVLTNKVKDLTCRYDRINELDAVSLKEKYLQVMSNGVRSEKGGAGLGIITMVLRSKNPSPYQVINISANFDMFTHTLSVDLG